MAVSASDWSCRVGNLLQPVRNTIQILIVNVISMEFLRSFLETSICGETRWSRKMSVVFSGLIPRYFSRAVSGFDQKPARGFRLKAEDVRVDRQPTPKHLRRTQSKPLLPRVQAWLSETQLILFSAPFKELITCGAKLLNADWLRQRAFFLKIKRALLVIKRALLLDADWI